MGRRSEGVLLAACMLLGITTAQAQVPPASAQLSSSNRGSTSTERWVWNELRVGRVADLNVRCRVSLDPREDKDTRWSNKCRRLGAAFLERVLTSEGWRAAPAHRGVRIVGARIAEPLDLSAARVVAETWLDSSRFENTVVFDRAKFEGMLSFNGSVFEHGLSADTLHVGGSLLMRDKAAVRGRPLVLAGAKVEESLDMNGSTFEAGVDASDMRVGGNFFVYDKAVVRGGALVLAGAKVEGTLDMNGSTFETSVEANRLRVGGTLVMDGSSFEAGVGASDMRVGNLFMRDKAVVRGKPLVLTNAKVEGNFEMDGSTFEAGVDANSIQVGDNLFVRDKAVVRGKPLVLTGAKVEGTLDMNGSTFGAGVEANSVQVGGNLFMHDKAVVRGGPLVLAGAKVEGILEMNGSTFEAGVDANSIQVSGNLFMRGKAVVRGKPLVLTGAKVEGTLDMNGSTFEAGVDANSVQVGGNLFMHDKAVVRGGPLVLANAKVEGNFEMGGSIFEADVIVNNMRVGGTLVMVGSTFEANVLADFLDVGGSLFLREATFAIAAQMYLARIGKHLDLSGADLAGLKLSGSMIGGELLLASAAHPLPRWRPDAQLILRNVRAGALQDRQGDLGTRSSWPSGEHSLDLQGFIYERLGGAVGGGQDMLKRGALYYTHLLALDPTFSRQPYQHLAGVFRAAGDPDSSDALLYAARDREMVDNWSNGHCRYGAGLLLLNGNCWSAVGLGVLKVTTGYGLGNGYWLALLWVGLFTSIGMLVLRSSPAAWAKGPAWRFGASLERLLPIVTLNKEFSDLFEDPNRNQLSRRQLAYFAFHALVGYVLAGFVAAALAGLTQAR